jgi:hypothetical protein
MADPGKHGDETIARNLLVALEALVLDAQIVRQPRVHVQAARRPRLDRDGSVEYNLAP